MRKFLFAFLIPLLYTGCAGRSERIVIDGMEQPAVIVKLRENHRSYEVFAVEGRVVVFFQESVSEQEAERILGSASAEILSCIPEWKYYVAAVPAGREGEAVSRLQAFPEVLYAYPDMIESTCAVIPYMIDNFDGDHGKRVEKILRENNAVPRAGKVNTGGDSFSSDFVSTALHQILGKLGRNDGAVINMSFGPGYKGRHLWNEAYYTPKRKRSLIQMNVKRMVEYVNIARHYDEKDFVIVRSAGNEGMKKYEIILDEVRAQLLQHSPEDTAVLSRHFLIVSAEDAYKEGDYPNDISGGKYDPLFTKVDISDKTMEDPHWQGTSFSAPRAAGFISSLARKHHIKAGEALQFARKATAYHPAHMLTKESMEDLIEGRSGNRKEFVAEGMMRMYRISNIDEEYARRVNRYYAADENSCTVFVLEPDEGIAVKEYLDEGDQALEDWGVETSFMVVPRFSYKGEEFALRYADKRVRVRGWLYAPMAGWRNATSCVVDLLALELVGEK